MPGVYLEPTGLLYGQAADEAISAGVALPLAGGPIAFSTVRLWEGEPGRVKHALVRAATLQAIDDDRVARILDRITATRPPCAGLAMDRVHLMGIVNVTPDSFSDGGAHETAAAGIAHGQTLAAEGASILDIGGESTRPGASFVPVDEELRRVIPVIAGLAEAGFTVSSDTRKPQVMNEAAKAGASILNDVSGLTFATDSLTTAARLGLPTVVMHAQGDPKTMQDNPVYADVAIEVYDFLERQIEAATEAGLPRASLIADPGIGFGKTLAHNLSLFRSLTVFHGLGVPVLIGASRKGLIRDTGGETHPRERLGGSIAAALTAVALGVQIVRVHDVKDTRQAISVWRELHFQERSIPSGPSRADGTAVATAAEDVR